MAQAYSKGAKLRLKRAMPELSETPRAKKRGKARMAQINREDAADLVVLQSRARRMGLTPAAAQDMRDQMLGEDAGMAISILCKPDEASALWQCYVTMTGAEARYHRSLGKSIHAKTAKIEMTPDRMETRADDRPDLRTQEERDRDAQTAWSRWDEQLNAVGIGHRAAIDTARMNFAPMTIDGAVTPAGQRFVAALRAVVKNIS